MSQGPAEKVEFVLFMSPGCKYCNNIIGKLKTKPELMKKFSITTRWDPNGRTDVSHLLLDMLTRDKTWTEGNDYNLSELRTQILEGGSFQDVFDPDMRTIEGILLRDL